MGYSSTSGSRSSQDTPSSCAQDGDREEVIGKYRAWILSGPGNALLDDPAELEGKTLGYWSKSKRNPETPCHGDVLLELTRSLDRPRHPWRIGPVPLLCSCLRFGCLFLAILGRGAGLER